MFWVVDFTILEFSKQSDNKAIEFASEHHVIESEKNEGKKMRFKDQYFLKLFEQLNFEEFFGLLWSVSNYQIHSMYTFIKYVYIL